MKQVAFTKHGILRGMDAASKSNTSEGRFGRMFRTLQKADFSPDVLKTLGDKMVSEADSVPTPEDANPRDDEENTGIFAGYTYLGQFIDHDITFDPASSLMKQNDPDALEDFRTPRFDLDNIYGRGPTISLTSMNQTGKNYYSVRGNSQEVILTTMYATLQEILRIQKIQVLQKGR